jgi:pre-mRNA cleavage complex 2 protein Pcf11
MPLKDWIKSREVEGDEVAVKADGTNGAGNASSSVDSKPELQFLTVPDDPVLASSHCPICQEKFETKWDYNVDEFVWTDARKVGERIFHASCYAEAAKDLNSLLKRNTPEPVLGKRKAEVILPLYVGFPSANNCQDDHIVFRSKIKTEPT